MVSFTFLNFWFFSELFPFFVFYYFLYFMPASQHIVKINTSNWRLGLVEYIMYNDIDIAKLWRHIWRHEFLTKSPMLPIWHFERLLDKRYYTYNLSCCYWLTIIFNWQKSTTPSCNGNHRLHNKCFAIMTNFRFTYKTIFLT